MKFSVVMRRAYRTGHVFYPGVIVLYLYPDINAVATAAERIEMNDTTHAQCTAFEGSHCIASGALNEVALAAKQAIDRAAHSSAPPPVLVFVDATSEVVELDWRGSKAAFKARVDSLLQAPTEVPAAHHTEAVDASLADTSAARGPGRPKLGVVAREVTLLPRHWEWLATQPGGASVALRKLVDTARRASEAKDRVRHASAVGYKFMATMAGHEAGFEEASRALFAADKIKFEMLISPWPKDVQTHLKKILADAFLASAANVN
jgi:hypothetical protein